MVRGLTAVRLAPVKATTQFDGKQELSARLAKSISGTDLAHEFLLAELDQELAERFEIKELWG